MFVNTLAPQSHPHQNQPTKLIIQLLIELYQIVITIRNITINNGIGSPHTNPVTLEDLMPHVHDKTVPGKVRAPYPGEIPGH